MMRRNKCCFLWLLLLVTLEWTLANEESVLDRKTSRGDETGKPAYVPKRAGYEANLSSVETFLDDFFGHEKKPRDGSIVGGRTFGHKRVQFLLMPMIYKMGVMMTMLTVLTVISLKGLTIGVILLVLKLASIFGSKLQGHAWSAASSQPVQIHVHNEPAHHQAYSGWSANALPEDEHYYYKG